MSRQVLPRLRLALQILALGAVPYLIAACGDDDGSATAERDEGELPQSSFGIHVRLKNSQKDFVVPPFGTVTPPAEEEEGEFEFDWDLVKFPFGQETSSVRSREQAIDIDSPSDYGVDEHGNPGGPVFIDPAWLLSWGAAAECEYVVMANLPRPYAQAAANEPRDAVDWNVADVPWDIRAAGTGANDKAWYFIADRRGTGVGDGFRSCDEVLRAEQLLSCMASKLEEVATAVGDVTWTGPGLMYPDDGSVIPAALKETWVIPPQRSEDRFIARDAALNALAHLALATSIDPKGRVETNNQIFNVPGAKTCSEAWVKVLQSSTPSTIVGTSYPGITSDIDVLWGKKAFSCGALPCAGTETNSVTARRNLDIHVATLQGAGVMLRRLVDEGVTADLQGAAVRRQDATDHLRGLEAYWGVDIKTAEEGNSYNVPTFNSVDHALSLVVGRRENGYFFGFFEHEQMMPRGGIISGTHFTSCGGINPDDLLSGVGSGYNASPVIASPALAGRWTAAPLRTADQQAAFDLLVANGIVIRHAALTGGPVSATTGMVSLPSESDRAAAISSARNAVLKQLLLNAARERGLASADDDWHIDPARPTEDAVPFKDSELGKQIEVQVKEIADADLALAIQKVEAAYRLITGAEAGKAPRGSGGVEVLSGAAVASELSAITVSGGSGVSLVVKGRFPLEDLKYDVFASTAGARDNSICEMYVPQGDHPMEPHVGRRESFQDAFMTGDILRRSLATVRDRLRVSGGADHPTLLREAELASAAILTWTGPGRIWIEKAEAPTNYTPTESLAGAWKVHLTGYALDDFEIDDVANIDQRLQVVYGPAWFADCAAGLRTSCRFGPQWKAVCEGGAPDPDDEYDCSLSVPTADVELKVLTPSSRTLNETALAAYEGIEGDVISLGFTNLEHALYEGEPNSGTFQYHKYHLVERPRSGKAGRVLASFLPKTINYLPPHYRWHTMVVSDFQRELLNRILLPGDDVVEPKYTATGDDREPFIPLENELTNDSDEYETSWRHYLTMARLAAQKADELGREIIEIGLTKDLRREAAGEEIANICGSYGQLDKARVDENGEMSLDGADGALRACIGEDVYAIAGVSDAPPDLTGPNPSASSVRSYYMPGACASSGNEDDPLCTAGNENFYAALGLSALPASVDPEGGPSNQGGCYDRAKSLLTKARAPGVIPGAELQSLGLHPDLTSSSLGAIIGPARLVGSFENNEFHFSLSFDDEVVMSTIQNVVNPSTQVWPRACTSNGPPACSLHGKFTEVFGDQSSALGTQGQRFALYQRVASALWRIGALAGYVPEGIITGPVMVANFSGNHSGSNPALETYLENPLLVYGSGRMVSDGSLYWLNTTGIFDEHDRSVLGALRPYPANFLDQVAANENQPAWLKGLYTRAGAESATHRYLYGYGQSVSRSWPNADPAGTLGIISKFSYSCGSGASLTSMMGPTVRALTIGTGELCQVPAGDATLVASLSQVTVNDVVDGGHGSDKKACNEYVPDGEKEGRCVLADTNKVEACKPESVSSGAGVNAVSVKRYTNSCLNADSLGTADPDPTKWIDDDRMTRRMLQPSACSPHERVQVFAGTNNVYSDCEAAEALVETLAFACLIKNERSSMPGGSPAPNVAEPEDIPRLEAWLLQQETVFREHLAKMAFRDVPIRVVEDIRNNTVGSGDIAGEHGRLILQLEEDIRNFANEVTTVGGLYTQIGGAVGNAKIALQGAEIGKNMTLKRLAMERLDLVSRTAAAAAGIVAGMAQAGNPIAWLFGSGAGGAANAAAAVVELGVSVKQMNNLGEVEDLAEDDAANQVAGVLSNLSTETAPIWTQVQTSIENLEILQGRIADTQRALRDQANAAQYQLAKGAGEPFVKIGGNIVEFPVNIVNNRLYDIAAQRYAAAFKSAQNRAHWARLAIEKRIGLRLCDIAQPVGEMAAPAEWCEDWNTMSGVDYDELRTVDGGATVDLEFASPFIGDYVDRLEQFVEVYNQTYPSQDGKDVAVLSLRDDLMMSAGLCRVDGANLLYFSGHLGSGESVPSADEGGDVEHHGWLTRPCDEEYCLRVAESPDGLGPPGNVGSATWLRDEVSTLGDSDLEDPRAERAVYQEVNLDAGTSYSLTWWDTSLDGATGDPATTTTEYSVVVYDANWDVVAATFQVPHFATDLNAPAEWSARRLLQVTPATSGIHYVTVSSGIPGEAGSIGIANLQLERDTASGIQPFIPTDAARTVLSADCLTGDPEAFRAAFDEVCEDEECYYELRQPIVINTALMNEEPNSPLNGRFARGNFNYRHIDVAVNVVGTGVRDCQNSGTDSCYGTGFLEYTLDHAAYNVPVLTWEGEANEFSFGTGSIVRGKALATERYITLPISSTDQSLLQQPQTTKTELRGRPLSGSYRFRIHKTDELAWDRVDDVQLVFTYRYWSKVLPTD